MTATATCTTSLPSIYRIQGRQRGDALEALIAVLAARPTSSTATSGACTTTGSSRPATVVVPYIADLLDVRGLLRGRARDGETSGRTSPTRSATGGARARSPCSSSWPTTSPAGAPRGRVLPAAGHDAQYVNHLRPGNIHVLTSATPTRWSCSAGPSNGARTRPMCAAFRPGGGGTTSRTSGSSSGGCRAMP